ncbi:MAG TPA: hypothetical protein VHC90_16715 [Bryobacteraceae bacterium]|nr:hypothetical protein [Bryobacteraceae bacterium]
MVFGADPNASPEPQALYSRIAKMASALSDGDAYRAIESFDKNMPGYNSIVEHIQALTEQTEILCSIEVVSDKEADNPAADIHHLDLDWFMTLTSKADGGPVERRRMRVEVAARRVKTKSGEDWRIIELSPASIFDPIKIS